MNCYTYAISDSDDDTGQTVTSPTLHIPGNNKHKTHYNCSDIMIGLMEDLPGTYKLESNTSACATGFKKIFSAVSDETGQNDFHFWREDDNGTWSHKPGERPRSFVDASGNPITNPETSDRQFQHRNYIDTCGFYCVPRM